MRTLFTKTVILFLFIFVGLHSSQAANYYWVGGAGNWGDLTHWATTSGGTSFHIIVPGPYDNVIFDANSGFTIGNNTITTNSSAYCRNMIWDNAPADPIFNESNSYEFYVFESLTLQPTVTFNARVYFTGNAAGTITSNGAWIRGAIEIDKGAGNSITLADDLYVNYLNGNYMLGLMGAILHTSGTFNLGGRTAYADCYYSSNNNTRHLNLTNSTLWLKSTHLGLTWQHYVYLFPGSSSGTYNGFVYQGSNKTVAAANSLIRQSEGYHGLEISGGTQLTFNNFWYENPNAGNNGNWQSNIGNSIFNVMRTSAGAHTFYSSTGAQIDSLLFNTVTTDWSYNSSNQFNGYGTSIGTLIFYGVSSQAPIYTNIIGGNSNNIAYADFKSDGTISGSNNTFGNLVFTPGYTYRFGSGTNNTINGNWYASGNPCYLTEIVRSSTSGYATITKNGTPVNLDYVRVNGITAAGTASPFSAGEHSLDLGLNTNWNFTAYNPGAPIAGLGPDLTLCPSLYPYTLNTTGFVGGPATTYTWFDGSTGSTYEIDGPGTYWVSVDYGRSCILTDSVTVTDQFEVSFSNHQPVCDPGDPKGTVTALATGSSGPYAYSWNSSPVQDSSVLVDVNAGTYTVTITDALGCVYSDSTIVVGPSTGLAFNVDIPSGTVYPDCDPSSSGTGSATAVTTGGSAPYSLAWSTSPVQSTASVFNLNAGTYEVIATDANGCVDSAEVIILDQTGAFSGTVDVIHPTGCDLTGEATVNITGGTSPFDYQWTHDPLETSLASDSVPTGDHSVTVIDDNNCITNLPFVINSPDSIAPTFMDCPTDISVPNDLGTCGAIVTWTPPTADDTCGVGSITATHNPGAYFPVGTTTVSYFATDVFGNRDTCSFTITVQDIQAPQFVVCPSNIILTATAGNCSVTANWTPPVANDNCSTVTVVGDFPPGTAFPIGSTTVTYIATDASGNTSTCQFKVVVKAHPSNFYISGCNSNQSWWTTSDQQCFRSVSLSTPSVTNLCGNYFLVNDTYAPGQTYDFPVGATTVLHRYTNGADTISCSYTITVYDNYWPTVSSFPSSVSIVADTCGGRRHSWTEPIPFDACGIDTMYSSHPSGYLFPVGQTYVQYTVVSNTNQTNYYGFYVTVSDPAPVISGCPTNLVLAADTCGGRRVSWTPPTASDNCLTSFTSNYNPGDLFPVGVTIVTYTAIGSNGASVTCSFNVTINATYPQVTNTCPSDITINLDAVTCDTAVTWIPPTFSHPCGIDTIVASHTPGDTLLPGTYNVSYVATSNDGFTGSCNFTITINAFATPIEISGCPPYNPTQGFAWYTQQVGTSQFCGEVIAAWPEPTFSTSNCVNPVDTVILSSPIEMGDTVSIGIYYIDYTAYDSVGNAIASCSFYYEVTDTLSGVFSDNCPSSTMTVQINPLVSCTEAVVDFEIPEFYSVGCVALIDTVVGNIHPGDTLSLGYHNIYYEALDSLGNWIGACSFDINIVDTLSGVTITCPPTTFNANWGHEAWYIDYNPTTCEGVANWPEPTFVANGCTSLVDTVYGNINVGDVLPLGVHYVSYNAYDEMGNWLGSCEFYAHVGYPDSIYHFPADTTVTTDPITCMATVNWENPTTEQICGNTPGWWLNTYSSNWWENGANPYYNNSNQQLPIGVYTVQYYADNGSSGYYHTFTITVVDGSEPTFGTSCPADTVLLSSAYNMCGGIAAWEVPTATSGPCAPPSNAALTITSNYSPGALLPIGSTEVIYTATNEAGLSTTCEFVATVIDVQGPVFNTCPTDILANASASSCDAEVSWTAPTVFDNCPGTIVTSSHTPGSMFPIGATTVTYVATDASGNSANCSFTVTVTDYVAPVISGCPNNMVVSNDNNSCGAIVSWVAPTASDNCSVSSFTSSHNSGDFFPIGTTVVTYTAIDAAGLQATCSFTIKVEDTQVPLLLNCPSDITVSTSFNICAAQVNWIAPTAGDNCTGSATITSTHSPGDLFPIGVTPVTYYITDAANNKDSCTFNVTVVDNHSPLITTCPPSVTVPATSGTCEAVVSWTTPIALDNCMGVSLSSNFNSGALFPIGSNLVTYTATDAAGLTATCSFTVTVIDQQPPVMSNCPSNMTVSTSPGSCDATVNWTAPTATDNCGMPTITASHTSGDVFPIGTTTVTYTATDAAGLTATCSFTITVVDQEVPVIVDCPTNITVASDASSCSAIANWTAPTATDNCGTPILTSNYASGATFPVGTTMVTYTATDAAGLQTTCSFTVTVEDTSVPTFTNCPSDVTVNAGFNACSATATWTAPTASDNCLGSAVITSSHTPGQSFPVGTTEVTYQITDAAGNVQTCLFNVIVTDATPPQITSCPPNVSVPATAGSCDATVSWATPIALDNCSGVTLTSDYASGDVFPIGTTLVTYTATDAAGLTATCSFTVTVSDQEAPVFAGCPADIVVPSGSCDGIATWTAPTATDNCGMPTIMASHTSGDVFPIGTTTVTYTATDATGLTATCSFTVTVSDQVAPQFTNCPANITVSAGVSACDAVATWTAPTVSDNCGTPTVTASHTSGDSFPIGTTTVTYIATDAAGYSDTCMFTVTVEDTQTPTFVNCPSNITVDADFNTCTAQPSWNAPVGSDNCLASALVTNTHAPGDVFPIGTTTVVYEITDAAGNTVSCSFDITVIDVTLPQITACPPSVTVGTDVGSCDAVVSWTTPIALDNCSGVTLASTFSSGDTFPLGTTAVTYTATDDAGLQVSCSFNVTVIDMQAPVFTDCPTDISVSSDAGSCDAIVNWTAPLATDNCGAATITSNFESGDTFPLGTTIVTYTATDANGLTSNCTFRITVVDQEAPVFVDCPSDLTIDAGDSCTIAVNWTVPAANDNCGIATTSSSHASGDLFEIGTTVVTYVATDNSGLTTTCSFTITVTGDPENCEDVEEPKPGIVVPEAFTPDGDGINDLLVIQGIEYYPYNDFVIFNRWGNEVFKAHGYNNDWDGSNSSATSIGGEELPTATYFYVLDTKDPSIGVLRGYIYLQR